MNAFELLKTVKAQPEVASKLILDYLNDIFRSQNHIFSEVTFDSTSKVALNSLNGVCKLSSGEELFFKFHSESNETIALEETEIYNVEILKSAGWDMILPFASSTEPGCQCVLYPLIKDKTVYTLLKELDIQYLNEHKYDETKKIEILEALKTSLTSVSTAIIETMLPQDFSLSKATIHQLFSHRLVPSKNETVRVESFYESNPAYQQIKDCKWIVNGNEIPWTLSELVSDSKKYLSASFSDGMASVVAHGDEHFGNQFFIGGKIVFFDPAFAGRMPALLAAVKAIAHNVIAHPLWYYEPCEVVNKIDYEIQKNENGISVNHNWSQLHSASIRAEIEDLYVENLWRPIIKNLHAINCLPDWWSQYVKCAIFCSPFLAKNVLNQLEYSQEGQSLFNIAKIIEDTDRIVSKLLKRTLF